MPDNVMECGQSAPASASAASDVATKTASGNTKSSPRIDVPINERAGYTPNEFAALFGKQTVWGYRQIYAGRVRVITVLGRMLIPASEVKRLQGEAGVYEGDPSKRRRNKQPEPSVVPAAV